MRTSGWPHFDPHDRFHAWSTVFLRVVAERKLTLHGPTFVALEVACALARRAGDPAVGAIGDERLRGHPTLRLHPLDDRLLALAREIGVQQMLRGADAVYAATARIAATPLITWDDELVQCAGGLTPDSWLAAHP
jgi:predicted nucleic acid-binding protein